MREHPVVKGWLAALSKEVGTSLALNEEGVCSLGGLREPVVYLAAGDAREPLHLWIDLKDLGPLEDDHRADLMRRALVLDLAGRKTRGACISLDSTGRRLVLGYRVPVTTCDDAFVNMVGCLLETALDLLPKLDPDKVPTVANEIESARPAPPTAASAKHGNLTHC
ncbi:Type III secretion system chaperone [Sulfidibacter corallicola]|uniref:Type III secretion system chaperone n=1 Tax=Sulfidibacter corallicola TaxID=2818388 RepID=A0A8A4TWJ5_SULCO|nr:CesT family type III secretion system chaperone [Sulfidibacter corallicola]QTD50895.1 type III secretion system chaperone [Sulfidibacter corallicola]